MVKNIAIKGAGCGIGTYIGAMLPLEQKGILKNIEKVAGTSAGSIIACLLSLKYTSKEMFDIYEQLDFSKFEDGNLIDKVKVLDKYGLYRGDYFLEFIKDKILRKGLKETATFENLHNAGCLDLYVYATNLTTQTVQEFSFKETPDVSVCDAVRSSMSIPILFDAYKIGVNLFVDGGCVLNYPIGVFDNGFANPETLGLHFGTLNESKINNAINYQQPVKYAKALVNSVLNSQTINLSKSPEDIERTIFIPTGGISATNFNLTTEDKMLMFKNGINAVNGYFK